MHRKDRRLEIVDEFLLPCLDRLANDVAAAFRRLLRSDGSVGILGAYSDVITLHHHNVISLHVVSRTAYRHQYIADTLSIAGCISILRIRTDEVGTVGTQFGSISLHLRNTDVQAETLIEQTDHIGSIRRAATHSSLRWDSLDEMRMNAGNLEVGSQHIICLHHQVFLFVAIHGIACNLQVAGYLARKFFSHQLDLQGISQGDRVEYGFQVVVTISALAYYI